jgi:hypothetical protein
MRSGRPRFVRRRCTPAPRQAGPVRPATARRRRTFAAQPCSLPTATQPDGLESMSLGGGGAIEPPDRHLRADSTGSTGSSRRRLPYSRESAERSRPAPYDPCPTPMMAKAGRRSGRTLPSRWNPCRPRLNRRPDRPLPWARHGRADTSGNGEGLGLPYDEALSSALFECGSHWCDLGPRPRIAFWPFASHRPVQALTTES